ncbi:hypothetical protein PR202_ga06590 [Eleusine coracana subsp. coracana]|uniref:Knottins-like domain-containing protein n=1 Tax=Eleusine coracana subsp. coracana TaxID=191504 RepID=A0AAV5BXN6_ELECO|nr:hypothetical protein PR202_ga06590 [Eleusine coracana subsp. coracana]
MNDRIAATALFLLLLAFGAEAMLCTTPSQTYQGRCVHSTNCAAICITEGNSGGYCKGKLVAKCICTKACTPSGGGRPVKPPSAPSSGGPVKPPSAPGSGGPVKPPLAFGSGGPVKPPPAPVSGGAVQPPPAPSGSGGAVKPPPAPVCGGAVIPPPAPKN